jgi:hypothetical protein
MPGNNRVHLQGINRYYFMLKYPEYQQNVAFVMSEVRVYVILIKLRVAGGTIVFGITFFCKVFSLFRKMRRHQHSKVPLCVSQWIRTLLVTRLDSVRHVIDRSHFPP